MLSSVLGIAIVALPADIITAGYMTELEKNLKNGIPIKKNPIRIRKNKDNKKLDKICSRLVSLRMRKFRNTGKEAVSGRDY